MSLCLRGEVVGWLGRGRAKEAEAPFCLAWERGCAISPRGAVCGGAAARPFRALCAESPGSASPAGPHPPSDRLPPCRRKMLAVSIKVPLLHEDWKLSPD